MQAKDNHKHYILIKFSAPQRLGSADGSVLLSMISKSASSVRPLCYKGAKQCYWAETVENLLSKMLKPTTVPMYSLLYLCWGLCLKVEFRYVRINPETVRNYRVPFAQKQRRIDERIRLQVVEHGEVDNDVTS
jgi:hypothetical protein